MVLEYGVEMDFCCKSNPGKGEIVQLDQEQFVLSQCSTDYKSLQFLENKDSIICSQMIGNRHQLEEEEHLK